MTPRSSRLLAAALSSLLVSLALGCASLPGIDEVNAFSVQDEWRLGAELEAEYEKRLVLVRDPEAQRLVNELGLELVRQGRLADRPWEFHLVQADEINAFNIPGGHVYVNTGLVLASADGSELVGVLGHETAHGMERHATQQLTRAYGLQVMLSLALGKDAGVLEDIAANLAASGTLAHYSREAEREADAEGVRLLHAAGWDPNGLPRMFEKLLAARGDAPGRVEQFFASHPMTENRLAEVRAAIAALPNGGAGGRSDSAAFRALKDRLRR